jgi:betaine-aldehyde dehydrogenase
MSVLEDFANLNAKLFVDGALRASEASDGFDVIEPATETTLSQVADATDAEVEEAVAAANLAQKTWNAQNALTRAEALHEVARRLRALSPRLAEAMTREMGKPYKESADEVEWSATAFDYYAEAARHDAGRVIGPIADGQLHFTVKEPLGTVVIILPFNFPYVLYSWQAAAALATGNAVILKPSENSSLCSLMMMEAFSHLPAGLAQCVTGGGRVGARLVEHQDTHGVAFTGGVSTGQTVARACAETFKRVLIEASGNDPLLVMPSAPMDVAARGATFAAYLNCGQVCTSAERIYVHESIHDEFVERMVGLADGLRIGNGLEKVDMGPMVSSRERDRYEGVLRRAIEQGAKVATGGGRPAQFNVGWYVEATVLTECTPDMDILNNESFGPVAPICRVKDLDEAIELANRSNLGLGATIFTTDLKETMRAVNELVAGMVWVNAPVLDNDAGPFGGRKMSGTGRQLGAEGLDQFRNTKFVMIDPNCNPQDFWWFPYADEEAYPTT